MRAGGLRSLRRPPHPIVPVAQTGRGKVPRPGSSLIEYVHQSIDLHDGAGAEARQRNRRSETDRAAHRVQLARVLVGLSCFGFSSDVRVRDCDARTRQHQGFRYIAGLLALR